MKKIMNNHQILAKKFLYVGNLSPVVTEEDLNELFGFKTTSYLQKTCKVDLSVCPKTGNSRCLAHVTVPYHVYKEIIKINDVVFKSKPIKIEDAKVKPKARSQQYKISENSYNPLVQKQQTTDQQYQSQYQQPAAQHLPILQSPNQQNFVLKSQYAMHQREQLKSNHQDQQKGNKKEIFKTDQENESLLTVTSEMSYKETLIAQKKIVIIFGDAYQRELIRGF